MTKIKSLYTLEERLVRQLISTWSRRGSSLLLVGLHGLLDPEFFWDAGFDVCVTEEHLQISQEAYARSGPRIEYRLAPISALPFDDKSFDYTVFTCYASSSYQNQAIKLAQENKTEKQFTDIFKDKTILASLQETQVFEECCRVASKGVLILFKNKFSPPMGSRRKEISKTSINPYSLIRRLKKISPDAYLDYSSSCLMPRILEKVLPSSIVIPHCPLGHITGVCLQFNSNILTGLGLEVKVEKALTEEAVIQRNLHNKKLT